MSDLSFGSLNQRAEALGYEVLPDDVPVYPRADDGGPYLHLAGGGAWCRVYRDGAPISKFSWSTCEVDYWLTFREREAA